MGWDPEQRPLLACRRLSRLWPPLQWVQPSADGLRDLRGLQSPQPCRGLSFLLTAGHLLTSGRTWGEGRAGASPQALSARAPEGQSRGLGCSHQVGVGVIFQVSLWSMTGRPGRPGWPGQVCGGSGVGLGVGEEFLRVSQASWPGPPLRLHPAGSPLPRVKQHCPGRRELGPTRPRGACYPKLGASGLLPFPCG